MARDGATACFVLSTDVVPVSYRSAWAGSARARSAPARPKPGLPILSVARDTVAPQSVTQQKGPPLRQILASPKMLAIMVMAAASGYPNQLTESALQAWLKDSHVSNTAI